MSLKLGKANEGFGSRIIVLFLAGEKVLPIKRFHLRGYKRNKGASIRHTEEFGTLSPVDVDMCIQESVDYVGRAKSHATIC